MSSAVWVGLLLLLCRRPALRSSKRAGSPRRRVLWHGIESFLWNVFFVFVGVGGAFLPNIDDSDAGSGCGKYEAAVLRSTFRLFVSSPQKSCFCLPTFFHFLKHELQGLCTMRTTAWSLKRGASASRKLRFVVVFASLDRFFSEYVTGRQVRNIR